MKLRDLNNDVIYCALDRGYVRPTLFVLSVCFGPCFDGSSSDMVCQWIDAFAGKFKAGESIFHIQDFDALEHDVREIS